MDKEGFYYFYISADGFNAISSYDTTTYSYDNFIDSTYYYLNPTPVPITVNLTWSNARDFDFSVAASDYDYFYRNADRTTAPGGESYTLNNLHGGETLIAYAYFFSNEVAMSTAAPTVTFTYNGTVFDTVTFNGTDSSSDNRYWLAACFDSQRNVVVQDRVLSYVPSVYDCL